MMEAPLLQNHSWCVTLRNCTPLDLFENMGWSQPRFLQTMTLILVIVETGRIFLHPFPISAVAVLLVAPLLCDGEPNPGGRGGGRGGGEYAIFAS